MERIAARQSPVGHLQAEVLRPGKRKPQKETPILRRHRRCALVDGSLSFGIVSGTFSAPSTSSVNNHRGRGVTPGYRRRRRNRLRVRHWRVRTKLAVVLTIPAAAFVAIAGLQTLSS